MRTFKSTRFPDATIRNYESGGDEWIEVRARRGHVQFWSRGAEASSDVGDGATANALRMIVETAFARARTGADTSDAFAIAVNGWERWYGVPISLRGWLESTEYADACSITTRELLS